MCIFIRTGHSGGEAETDRGLIRSGEAGPSPAQHTVTGHQPPAAGSPAPAPVTSRAQPPPGGMDLRFAVVMLAEGFTHPQVEAPLTAARQSPNPSDFALAAMLGLLGLRIFEATSADIADLGEEHGHRVLRVCGKGTKIVLVPLPPAAGRAIDRAVGDRMRGPVLLNSRGARMDRHAATRRLRRLAEAAGIQVATAHPHMLRHTFVTTML